MKSPGPLYIRVLHWPSRFWIGVLITLFVHVVHGQFTYVTNNGTLTVTGYLGGGGTVVVPSSIDGLPVTGLGNPSYGFGGAFGITSLSIPNTVTNIAFNSFAGAPNLSAVIVDPLNSSFSSVSGVLFSKDGTALWVYPPKKTGAYVVPNGVTMIGESAFLNNSQLHDVTLPATLVNIGPSAFRNCTGLTNLTLPDSITLIGDRAFEDCREMRYLTLPASLASIGATAFQNCWRLSEMTIPAGVTNIGDFAFANCTRVRQLAIGNQVQHIGANAFQRCVGLTNITLPASIISMGQGVFYDCENLKSATILAPSTGESLFANCPSLSEVVLAEGLTNIASQTFYYCTALTNLSLPKTVLRIEAGAFFGCDALSAIDIPDSVTQLGGAVFHSCSSLATVSLGKGLRTISHMAFYGCASLSRIAIPANIVSIDTSAFSGCIALASVTMGSSLTNIGASAFYDCSSLTNVTIPRRVTTIHTSAFGSCPSLAAVYFEGDAPNPRDLSESMFFPATQAIVYYLPGTAGWQATLAGAPTLLWNPMVDIATIRLEGVGFAFDVVGTPNIPVVVERNVGLMAAEWTAVDTVNLTNGRYRFVDGWSPDVGTHLYRFRSP